MESEEMPDRPAAVLLAGPTASGKSAVALDLARRFNGVIVNADSMQVYDGLRVLTARPGEEDLVAAPHRLYGHVSPRERYSTGRWLADVAPVLNEIAAAGQVPIVTGGTGLYFRVLTEGLAAIPDIPGDIRQTWETRAREEGADALHAELARLAPDEARRVRPSDQTRVVRALEVLEATGKTLAEWLSEAPNPPLVDQNEAIRIVLLPERAVLLERIEARARAMIEAGALEEVAAFDRLDVPADYPAAKAIGVRVLSRHLGGEMSLEDALEDMIVETRRYAKRQSTWFRNQMPDWQRAGTSEEALDLAGQRA